MSPNPPHRLLKRPSPPSLLMAASLLLTFTMQAQEPGHPTEVRILGVVHPGNRHIDHRTLHRALVRNRPDLVLWEMDVDFARVFGLLTAYRLRIARTSIEQPALQRFSRGNRSIPILGFDTLIPDRKAYIRETDRIDTTIHGHLARAGLSGPDSATYARYRSLSDSLLAGDLEGTLADINNRDVVERIRRLYRMEAEILPPLATRHVGDTTLLQAFRDDQAFWIARNEHMVGRIRRHAERHPGKRIVVLTGLFHKYYLADRLAEGQGRALSVVEPVF
jgi:hypothetical protein